MTLGTGTGSVEANPLADRQPITVTPRPLASSLDELLAGATDRQPMKTADSLSSASFERVVIDGQARVVKYLHCDDDWVMRATGDVRCRPTRLWASGLLDTLPPEIDHAVVAAADGLGRNGWGSAILMRDISAQLVPEGDDAVDLAIHAQVIDHMGAMHAHYWGRTDQLGDAVAALAPDPNRICWFHPQLTASEAGLGHSGGVPSLVAGAWSTLRDISPELGRGVADLFADPQPLLDALADQPGTLVHSDWKFGNLGVSPAVDAHGGTAVTYLLDWAFPGIGPGFTDLGWYLAVNCRRLPESKDATIDRYLAALERQGVTVPAERLERDLAIALLGAFLQLGWSKALDGRDDEFIWWERRSLAAMALL